MKKIYIKKFDEFLLENHSGDEMWRWLWKPFVSFIIELDNYVKKETADIIEIIDTKNPGQKIKKGFRILTKSIVNNDDGVFIEIKGSSGRFSINTVDNVHVPIFMRMIMTTDANSFRIGIMPDNEYAPLWFGIKYDKQNLQFIPTTFDRSDAINKTMQYTGYRHVVGDDVYFAISALTKGKMPIKNSSKEVAIKLQEIFNNAPIFDLTKHKGKITAMEYGL